MKEQESSAVLRGLDNRIIPKIESLLKKRDDRKEQTIRPSIAIALLKLFQKLPKCQFDVKLHRLLKVVCDVLTNRDSNERDVARKALAKMTAILNIEYLPDVIRQLAISLSEGYKIHVRTATLNSILLELAARDSQESTVMSATERRLFDKAVPGILDLIQRDLFGVAQERRDAQESHVRFVKEAQGAKAASSLEIVAGLISDSTNADDSTTTMHILVKPFLERLRDPSISSRIVGRVRDSLARIVAGLLKNRNIESTVILRFVRATLGPFIGELELKSAMNVVSDTVDEDDILKPIIVSGSRTLTRKHAQESDRSGKVVEWQPATLKAVASNRDAQSQKRLEEQSQWRVVDGASAPKLTGSGRQSLQSPITAPRSVNDITSRTAVVFSLNLLNPTLKNCISKTSEETLDPFVPLLTACACFCRDTEVVLLSLRCLGSLLRAKVSSLSNCSKALATKSLDMLISAGGNQEQQQAAFKMLTVLMSCTALPLDQEQMVVLISFLRESINESSKHTRALALLKAILGHQYISTALYELMDLVLEQTVRSSSEAVRSQCSSVFLSFFIDYPLSPSNHEAYLKQMTANVSYQHVHGRLSAIEMLSKLFAKLPEPLLEKYHRLMFIPMALQLTNDEMSECRDAIRQCIGKLLGHLSMEALQNLFEYSKRWCSRDSSSIKATAIQLFCLFVSIRPDFVKRGERGSLLVKICARCLRENSAEGRVNGYALGLVADLMEAFDDLVAKNFDLWRDMVKLATNTDKDIRVNSCHLLAKHVASVEPKSVLSQETTTFLTEQGAIFQLGRALCFLLDTSEKDTGEELTKPVIKMLTWTLQAMNCAPKLCYETNESNERDPVKWLMTRLSNIAKPKGTKRRQAVFKCFAAFGSCCPDIAFSHLELMLEPLHRAEIESNNETDQPTLFQSQQQSLLNESQRSQEAQIVKEVMYLLEESCPDETLFLSALTKVKKQAMEKKEKRKLEAKVEAVMDPQAFARKRIEKNNREKRRRKRRSDERKEERGGRAKRRHF